MCLSSNYLLFLYTCLIKERKFRGWNRLSEADVIPCCATVTQLKCAQCLNSILYRQSYRKEAFAIQRLYLYLTPSGPSTFSLYMYIKVCTFLFAPGICGSAFIYGGSGSSAFRIVGGSGLRGSKLYPFLKEIRKIVSH